MQFFLEKKKEPYDFCGQKVYRQQCLRQQIISIKKFAEQLPKSSLELRYRGMSDASSIAVASSLSVSIIEE